MRNHACINSRWVAWLAWFVPCREGTLLFALLMSGECHVHECGFTEGYAAQTSPKHAKRNARQQLLRSISRYCLPPGHSMHLAYVSTFSPPLETSLTREKGEGTEASKIRGRADKGSRFSMDTRKKEFRWIRIRKLKEEKERK